MLDDGLLPVLSVLYLSPKEFTPAKFAATVLTLAISFPTLFTYTLGEHSITAYIEKQTKSDKYFMITNHSLVSILKEYEDRYLSLTFNYKGTHHFIIKIR